MHDSISILGCGWLGLQLGKTLAGRGISIKGSTTKEENLALLQENKITPFTVNISDVVIESNNLSDFFNSRILIVNFPPERRSDIEVYHPEQVSRLIEAMRSTKIEKVLFVSSTSVYPDVNREVTEDEKGIPAKGSGRALLAAEQLFKSESNFSTTILRFGGLIGGDRLPGRFLAGKKDLKNGNSPVNLIHRDDCIELIYQIIIQGAWGETFNACSDKHPRRSQYYTRAAEIAGLQVPVFTDTETDEIAYKIIQSEKIKSTLKYHFKYADPLDAL